jgi:hypothetical protein
LSKIHKNVLLSIFNEFVFELFFWGIHFLVWIEIPCQIFLYKKEDICCPLVIQSIHHKNHERRLNKCPIMILS